MIDAELMVIYDPITTSYSRGDGKWFAQFYDRATAGFYAGTGATALEAIAWAMDEYTARGILKIHRVARGPEERPGDLFGRARKIMADMAKALDEAFEAPPRVLPATFEATIAIAGDVRDVVQVALTSSAPETLWFDAERGPMNDAAKKWSNEQAVALAAGGDDTPPRPREGSCFALQIDDATRANEPPTKKRKKAKGT